MRNPDSILPLLVALAIAVVLHLALLPVGATMLNRPSVLPDRAELAVDWSDVPEAVYTGTSPTVHFEIRNQGPVEANGIGWAIYWSPTPRLAEDAVPWFEWDPEWLGPDRIAPGGTATPGMVVHVLTDLAGPQFLVVVAQATNAEPATAATAVWIDTDQRPDLAIESVDAPERGVAGGAVPVGYTLTNRSREGWAKAGWIDRVILSPDEELSGEDLVLLNVPRRRPLGPGESTITGPYELRLPLGVQPGGYHLIIASDAAPRMLLGDIEEGARRYAQHTIPGWSLRQSVPLRIEPATHPDLAPRNLKLSSGEGQLTIGQPTALTFDVVNRSPLAAPSLLWGDRVYWSADDQVSPDDVVLVSEPRGAYPGELPGGGRYRSGSHEFVIQPDQVVSSTMHLIVVADDENNLDEGDYEGNNALALPIVIKQPVEAEQPEELKLGRDDEPERVTVAWIAHDDFQDLLARKSVTLQPVVQDQVDPTPNAPLERDPEDTGQQPAVAAAQPAPPTPNPADVPTPASQQVADTAVDPLDSETPGDLPDATPGAVDQLGDAAQDTPGVPQPLPTPPQSPPESPPTVASQEQGDKPTSAPRDDRESDPTTLIQADSVRPGQVLVGPGLEVKTFRPRWSAAARFSIPRNPKAVITFDPDGTVLQADLLNSTGFDNIDGPLLSSLYRWKATGQRLEQFDAPFQIEITILLNPNEPAEEAGEDRDNP